MKAYYAAVSVYKYSNLPLGIVDIQSHLQYITFILGCSAIYVHEHSYLGSSSIQVHLSRKTNNMMLSYTETQVFHGLGNARI